MKRIEVTVEVIAIVALLVLLGTWLLVILPSVRGGDVIFPSTLQAAPGTITGDVTRLQQSDDVRATISEQDTTAISNRVLMLRPDGDLAPNSWSKKGVCITRAACVNEAVVHDGNTTIIWTAINTAQIQQNFSLANWAAGSDVTFDYVQGWAWARKNNTNPTILDIAVTDNGVFCAGQFGGPITGPFTNYSTPQIATSCSGGAWTSAKFDTATLFLEKAASAGSTGATATAAGVTVQYDDSDFAVKAYVNFTGYEGGLTNVAYEGSTSLVGETLALQVSQDGATWTTIQSPFLTSVESLTTATTSPTLSAGNVYFRIVDSVTTDEAGQSFALDYFSIQADTPPPPPPPNPYDPEIVCTYAWVTRTFDCRLDPPPSPGGSWVVSEVRWILTNTRLQVVSTVTTPGFRASLPTNAPPWDVLNDEYLMGVVITHQFGTWSGTQGVTDWDVPWLVIFALVVVIALAGIYVGMSSSSRWVSVKDFRKGKRPSIAGYEARAISVEEYPVNWTSYRQMEPEQFSRFASERRGAKWIVYGVKGTGKHERVYVQTVRVPVKKGANA